MSDALKYGLPLTLSGVLVLVIVWLLFQPEKAALWASWLWTGVSRVWRRADRRAVAYRVQGEVNTARATLLKHGPADLLEGKLKLRWRDVDEAKAVIDRGEVVVFMRRSDHHGENVAHALMAYLPKALIPRARRYIEPQTMTAADLTVAKSVLSRDDSTRGALDVFYERHLDPAVLASDGMKDKLRDMDNIDLHGWLLRVLLVEYRLLGNRLHPGDCEPRCLAEGEALARWLGGLAALGKGETGSLVFRGEYFRVAVVFVALRDTLAEKGTQPYRQRTKRHLYKDRMDAVYLMARDPNLWAVEEIVDNLKTDGRVAEVESHQFRLRPDFAARKGFHREHAIVACLRRRRHGEDDVVPGDDAEEPIDPTELAEEVYDPTSAQAAGGVASEDAAAPTQQSPDRDHAELLVGHAADSPATTPAE